MTNSRTRYAAAFAAGAVAGLLLGWLVRGSEEASAPTSAAPAAAPARPAPSATTLAPRRRAQEGDEPQSAASHADSPLTSGAAGDPSASATSASSAAAPGAVAAKGTVTVAPGAAQRDGTSESAPPAAPAAPPAREAKGVVVDAVTQKPVAGARVLFAIATGGRSGSWWGDTTGEDGRFANRIDDDVDLADARMELRVSKEGYEPVRVAAEGGDLRVELRPRTSPVVFGRVAGLARGADGKPFTGEIEVNGHDGEGANATQWTVADASGAFLLEGMPPGSWQLQIGSGPRVEVSVPEGGEARVELTAGGRGDGFVVTDISPEDIPAAGERIDEKLRELRRLSAQIAESPTLDAGAKERLRRQIAQEMQRLGAEALAAAPRRDVAITGLPSSSRAWVRLEQRPRHFRRAEAQNGVARFSAVPQGDYLAVLVEPGRPDRTMPVTVAPGEGRLDVRFE
jgi:hypothetical protein